MPLQNHEGKVAAKEGPIRPLVEYAPWMLELSAFAD